MNYLTKHCLYKTLILSAIMQQDEVTTFTCLASMYALRNDDYIQLREILSNATFQALNSSAAVILHENFLQTFCVDENEFGHSAAEWNALEVKQNAYALFESLVSETGDYHNTLSTAAEKNDKMSVTLALLYYLSKAKSEAFLPLLRRAEGHGNAEAAVLLMAFEKEERKAVIFEKLCVNKEILLANDTTLVDLADYYGFENIKGVKNDD